MKSSSMWGVSSLLKRTIKAALMAAWSRSIYSATSMSKRSDSTIANYLTSHGSRSLPVPCLGTAHP
jgi:hypothetical protein